MRSGPKAAPLEVMFLDPAAEAATDAGITDSLTQSRLRLMILREPVIRHGHETGAILLFSRLRSTWHPAACVSLEVMFGMMTTDYSTMSKDEVAQHVGASFGQARQFIDRQEPIPADLWITLNQTVAALCQRVGIDAPEQLVQS